MVRYCRVCKHANLTLKFTLNKEGDWYSCANCCSDTASHDYDPASYDKEYLDKHHGLAGGIDAVERTMQTNLEWWQYFTPPAKTFLDVGCAEGAALRGMHRRGWRVWGWDVCNGTDGTWDVRVNPAFQASQFPHEFGAIACREVIEHVPGPTVLLEQLHQALLPNGLLQIQTPRPMATPDPIPYQRPHLQIFSPEAMAHALHHARFRVLDRLLWPQGQAWIARKE